MKLHIIGGFLGSGKTTAISGAAHHLSAQGKRVGIITNDQGQSLVDTAFFKNDEFPTLEVTGGCFCCNYNDLDAQINRLRESSDVIFAETVGSCADLVATVVKPLRHLRQDDITFTVFTDVRLLRQWLRGELLPLSGDIVYIFGKQIEEAGLLILNKSDLLSIEELQETEKLLQARFPGKPFHKQNSLDLNDVADWLQLLSIGTSAVPQIVLDIDYERYGAGEAQLAWLDEEIMLAFTSNGRDLMTSFIDEVLVSLRQQNIAIRHLKFFVESGQQAYKLSFPTLQALNWQTQLPPLSGDTAKVIVNARAETSADNLRKLIRQSLERVTSAENARFQEARVAAFHPGFPRPTHRYS